MAWLYQRPNSANWWMGFRKNGRQFLLTTKTSDRKQAEAKLRTYELLEQAEADGRLNDAFIAAITGKAQPSTTLHQAMRDFLGEAKGSTAEKTFERYKAILEAFAKNTGTTEAKPLLREIGPDDVRAYLTNRRAATSASTANLEKKIISSFFRWCIKNQLLKENPALPVKTFKDSEKEKTGRRAYTFQEVKVLHDKAPDDFWRYMVVAGFYSGLRMGDLILLRIGEIDFSENALRLTTMKTGRVIIIPMAKPLRDMLAKITAGIPVNGPNRRLWPEEAKRYEQHGAKVFSNEFHSMLLAPAGLAPKRTHAKKKNGRGTQREIGGVSFHCLRHSFVTFLKMTGSNPAIAKELAGHGSDLVNNLYTHLPPSILTEAVNKLPQL